MSEILDKKEPVARLRAPKAKYRLDASAGHLLRLAHQRYQSMFQECAAGLGLTGPQFATLLRLSELGRATQNHLGRLAGMDSATVQGVVRRLIERGLMGTAHDPLDRRMRVLTITEPMAVQVTPRRVAVGAQTPGRVVVDPGALALSPAAVRVETTGGRWSEPMAAGDDGRWRGTLVPPSERSTTALSVTIGELTLRVRPKIFVR